MRLMVPLLTGAFLTLYVLPLGVRPLVIPDEARYAEISREMLAMKDWVVPHLDGVRYFEKPVLGYWFHAAAVRAFGANAFAVRLPSAVAAGLTASLLFLWTRRFSNDEAAPLFAAAVFLVSFEVFVVGTFCVLDSLLSLFITATIVAFYFAYAEKSARSRMTFLALAGVACGLAFLTKGFLAVVIPVLAIVPFLLWQRRFKAFLRLAWVAVLPAVLVVLPWAVMIHRREPDFWRCFFWVEHVDRFVSPRRGQHPEPFWFYAPILLAGAMPWTVLAGPVVAGLRDANRRDPMVRLALCWLILPFLFFSVCSGKLGTYILPCFPPLALLIAMGVLTCLRRGDTKGFVWGAAVLLVATGLLLLVLLGGLIAVPAMSEAVALWKWGVAAAGLCLWGVLCWTGLRTGDMRRKLLLYCVGPVPFMFSWPFIVPAALEARKAPAAFLRSHATRISPDSILVAENGLTAAVCWCYGRDDVYILGSAGEYAYGLTYADSRHRGLDIEELRDMLAEPGGTGHVVLITKAKHYAEYKDQLPNPSYEDTDDGLVWIEYKHAHFAFDGLLSGEHISYSSAL